MFKNTYFLAFFLFSFILSFSACDDDTTVVDNLKDQEKRKVNVPRFAADSAYAYIEKQLSFGTREPSSVGHDKCKDWLVTKLKQQGAKVQEQTFSSTLYNNQKVTGTNIIASYNPTIRQRVLLGAHWDSRLVADKDPDASRQREPIAGADDGGSGVGVLLEISRQLKENPIPMGVDIIFFDLEDQGDEEGRNAYTWGLGAQYWARKLHTPNYKPKYGILLDMVGSKGARFTKEGYSMQYAPQIMNKVWAMAHRMNMQNYFVNSQTSAITDDHRFVNEIARIPMIDIINRPTDTTFGHYWHTHKDDIEVIDKKTLNAVGQLVLAVLYGESNGTF